MESAVTFSAKAALSRFLEIYPLYRFRRNSGEGYLLRVLLRTEEARLHSALSEILPLGQLLDTRLEITVWGGGMEQLLTRLPALESYVWLPQRSPEPEFYLASLSFRPDLTAGHVASSPGDWDYALLCTGDREAAAVEAWPYAPDQICGILRDGQLQPTFPERRDPAGSDRPDDDLLRRIAFNIHYGYEKYNHPRASMEEIEASFRDYNKESTLQNVMHIRSKLACCGITDPDLTAAAQKFAHVIREDPRIVSRLAVVEHNRWMMDKVMKGYRQAEDTRMMYAGSHISSHSELDKWHVCLVPCGADHRLTCSDWHTDETNCRPELDPLDRISLEVHRVCREIAENNRPFIKSFLDRCFSYLDVLTDLGADGKVGAEACLRSMESAISLMYQKKRIAAYRYDKSRQALLNILGEDKRKEAEGIRREIEQLDKYLKPLREYIIDKDYKEQDHQMVAQIPFAITRRPRPVLMKFFGYGGEDCQFSPWQLEPSEIFYFAYADSGEQLEFLRGQIRNIQNFLFYDCNSAAVQFHILLSPQFSTGDGQPDTAVFLHPLLRADTGEITETIRRILSPRLPDYMDMTAVHPMLLTPAADIARAEGIGSFHVFRGELRSIQGAEELEYPAPRKGITVREMFEQKGAVLAGCESAQLSDLSNVYRDFWQVSRTTDKWNSFCLFIDEAYRQQSAQVTYPLYSIGPGGTPGPIHSLRLHSHVLTKLLPLIRELEDRQYMQRIRIRWIVGDLLELSFCTPRARASARLAEVLDQINSTFDPRNTYTLKWDKAKPSIQLRQLSLKNARLPEALAEEFTQLLGRLRDADILTELKIKDGKASFKFSSESSLSFLRNSGKVLEHYLYYTALQECQFDDAEMSWLFFHSPQEGAAQNELDVICTRGTASLFISAKNVTRDTFRDAKFLNYVCYEVSQLADAFGIQAKTVLAAPNVPQFEGKARHNLVKRAMSRNVYLLGDRCFEPGKLSRVLENIAQGREDWCEFLLD